LTASGKDGADSRRLGGERAEHVHHVGHPEQSGRLPEWCRGYIDPSQPGGSQQALDMIARYDILPGANDPDVHVRLLPARQQPDREYRR
jgi:hypothetical protein